MAVRRLVAIIPAKHPNDLRDQGVAVDPLYDGPRLPSSNLLLDPEVGPRERCDLRKVGDAEHLALGSEIPKPLPHRARSVAADACIDLVEDEGRLAPARSLAGQSQHHA